MPRTTEHFPLLSISPGTSRELIIHRYGEAGKGPKVYIQASLHADEWPGMMAVHHLLPMLDEADAKGEILGELVIIPFVNPIGLSQRVGGRVDGRYAFDGTGNFNRNWVDLAEAAKSDIEGNFTGDASKDVAMVRAAFKQVVDGMSDKTEVQYWRKKIMSLSYDADYVLDLHCDGEATVHIYANVRQQETATHLCMDMDCPVLLLESAAGGGAFDETGSAPWWKIAENMDGASDLPFPCFGATVELRGRQDVSDVFGEKDAAGLMSFLRREGIVKGVATPQTDQTFTTKLAATDVLSAPHAGIVSYPLEIGARVKEGDVIAYVIDPCADNPAAGRTAIKTQTDGIFFARNDQRLVDPGDSVAKVAGKKLLADRQEGNLLEA